MNIFGTDYRQIATTAYDDITMEGGVPRLYLLTNPDAKSPFEVWAVVKDEQASRSRVRTVATFPSWIEAQAYYFGEVLELYENGMVTQSTYNFSKRIGEDVAREQA